MEGYEQVFAELEAEKTKLGVTEANVYADHERTLQGIRNLDSIAQLKNRKLEADHFKAEQLEALIRYAAAKPAEPGKPQTRVGEPKEYYITRLMTTISNEQELDDYLAKARKGCSISCTKTKPSSSNNPHEHKNLCTAGPKNPHQRRQKQTPVLGLRRQRQCAG
ncbi:MAG: hypothetical protein R2791_12415 [Saprospiraceae bacterium]